MKNFSFVFLLTTAIFFSLNTMGQISEALFDKQLSVSLRMIGHQLLYADGDSMTRVLPIEQNDNQYALRFESNFSFEPNELATIVKAQLKPYTNDRNFVVEVFSCDSNKNVYGFSLSQESDFEVIPCRGRNLETGCYYLLFTANPAYHNSSVSAGIAKSTQKPLWPLFLALLGVCLVGATFFYFNQRSRITVPLVTSENQIIQLGDTTFDTAAMKLNSNNSEQTLSGKESDLLELLIKHRNKTVTREEILNKVWNDEGAYVGRTLDVFISKLRKKLDDSSDIEILNIRGVGYKLVFSK